MRRIPLALGLLGLAACGGVKQEVTLSGVEVDRVEATLVAGRLRIRTGGARRVHLTATTGEKGGGGWLACDVRDRVLHVAPQEHAVQWASEIELTVPAGLDLKVWCREAAVELHGAWRRVDVQSVHGDVVAEVEALDGGALASEAGEVSVRVTGRPPSSDLTCKSAGEDVTVRVPRSYRGRIHVTSRRGEVDVPGHPALRQIIDPTGKAVIGFVGDAMTDAERAQELEEKRSPQAIWVSSVKGRASFALLD